MDSLLIQGGLGKKERGGVFEREVDTPMPTMRQALKGQLLFRDTNLFFLEFRIIIRKDYKDFSINLV